jgi:hypothetical protein
MTETVCEAFERAIAGDSQFVEARPKADRPRGTAMAMVIVGARTSSHPHPTPELR